MAKSREQELDELVKQEITKDPPRKPEKIILTPSTSQKLKEIADQDSGKK
jgi:hypothetical protein